MLVDKINSPALNLSQYQQFENLMVNFRKHLKGVIIQNSIVSTELNVIKEEFNDLKIMVYDKEFKRLASTISSAIKDALMKHFHQKQI
jgi:hypothetical protein